MRLFRFFTSIVTALCLASQGVDASSQARNPLNYLTLVETPEIHTPSHRVHASSSFDLTFDLHQESQHIRLSLEPNYDILHENAHVEYVDKEGNIRHVEKIVREDHKVFQGTSFLVGEDGSSMHVGWARIVVRRDGKHPLFEGAFTIMGDHHHIQLKSNYLQTKHELDPQLEESDDEYNVVFRDSDIGHQSHAELRRRGEDLACSADRLAFNTDLQHPIYQGMLKRDQGSWGTMSLSALLGKRQSIDGGGAGNGNGAGVNLKSSIGSTAGCPSTRKVALLGVATDCTYTGSFNSSDSARQNVITQVSTASELYQSTFNITLGLANITISDAECPSSASAATPWNTGCTANTTIEDRLNTFSAWRGQRGDNNAYWSLFSTCNTGAEVGLSWLGQLCESGTTSQQSSGSTQSVTGANVVIRTSTEWQVFAHETGHTFGAVHDCDSSTCADANTVNSGQCCPLSGSTCDANAQYMMNPYSASSIMTFSPCSIGNICSALGRNSVQSGCLSDNKGVVTITGNQCGNGIVEEGEDCDCGGAEACGSNSCCDPTTCKFTSGSVCDPSNEGCCSTQCQFAVSGTVCRASTGSCDPQEVCSGTNGTCPSDTTAPNGQSCGSGLECASGQCTSRDLQCKTIMGSYTSDNDTYACNSQTCTISCASPDFGPGVCYSMQQNFLDGTPCDGGGYCKNGVCAGSTVGGEVKSWIDDNKTLVIALASAIGAIVLLALLGCCLRCCGCTKRRRQQPLPAGVRPPPSRRHRPRGGGMQIPPVPNTFSDRGYGARNEQAWQQPQPPMQEWYPQPPPPPYQKHSYTPPYPGGGSSVRYG